MEGEKKHKAKKSLGQHFLKSKSAVLGIVAAGKITAQDTILEIGPGTGILTEALLKSPAKKIIAIEKDASLISLLTEKFSSEIKNKRLTIIEADALEVDLKKSKLEGGKYKLIANIPYYITGAILEKYIGGEVAPSLAVLLVQKEVAKRITARDGKESILSISIKAYGVPKIALKVPREAFKPAPKVDSAVLVVEDIHSNMTRNEEKVFFAIVKAGFAHKRKQLLSNLNDLYDKKTLETAFTELKLSPSIRAERLTLKDWLALTELLP